MALKDEAGGGGGSARENRVLFFEIVAGTRLVKNGVQLAISEFKKIGDNWTQIKTGMDATTKDMLDKIVTKTAETVVKQKAEMDKLVAAQTENMDKQTAAAQASYDAQQAALAEMLARQTEAYDANLKALVEANQAKVAKVEEQAKREADSQIEQNRRAFDAQMLNIRKLAEVTSATGNIPANVRANGIAAIGTAVAMSGAAGQQANMNTGATLAQGAAVATARQEAVDVEAIANEEHDKLIALAQSTATELLAKAEQQKTSLIEAAKATAAGIVAAQEEENAKVIALMKEQSAALEETSSVGTRASGVIGGLGHSFMGALVGVSLFTGVVATLFTALKSATDAVSSWATEIVQASEATGLSYRNTQVYLAVVEQFGVSHAIAETILTRFNKRLQENAGLFSTLGITAKDPNIALVQFMDNISHSADKLQYFNTVIGGTVRSGSVPALVDAFDKLASAEGGAAQGMQMYANIMSATGMLLDDQTVKAGALSSAIETQLGDALEGLKMRIGAAILPNMQALELVFIQLISGSSDASKGVGALANVFEDLAKWISNAIGYVVGFIAGMTGMTSTDLNSWFTKAAAGASALATGTADSAKSVTDLKKEITALQQKQKDLEQSTKLQTEALDSQITALQRNQKAFDDAHDDKVKALENEKTNYEDALKLQDDLHQSYLRQLQDQLQALQDTQSSRRQSGEDLASYETRLAEQSLQKSITTEQNRRQTVSDTLQQQIDLTKQASDAAKEAFDNTTAAQVQALQDQKKHLQDFLTQQQAAITAQVQKDQNILNGAADGTTATVEMSAKELQGLISTAIKAMGDSATNGGMTAGKNFVDSFKGFLKDPKGELTGDALALGKTIGGAMVQGMLAGLIDSAHAVASAPGDLLNNLPVVGGLLKNALNAGPGFGAILGKTDNASGSIAGALANRPDYFSSLIKNLPTAHASGGVFNKPHLSWTAEAGSEAIIPLTNPGRAAAVMQQAGLGGHTFVSNFNGPVATPMVAGMVMDRLAAEAKRKGLIMGAGI